MTNLTRTFKENYENMTTMKTNLPNNPKLCNLSTSIGHNSIDLNEIAALASKVAHQLANLDDNTSVDQLAVSARDIWSWTKKIDCPNTPDNQYIDDEMMASLIMTDYTPNTPDEEFRSIAAAKSAARGLAILCKLMAQRFVDIGES